MAHLPPAKQRQLRSIVRIIRATADIERVVLFGSHARGDWVEDPATGYMSDFDLLVLVTSPALAADEALWADCHDRARDAAGDTPVSLLVHTVADVKDQLARGSSFFRDAITEGIVLHDAGRLAIAEITPLTPAQHHALARASVPRYFERAAQLSASFEHSLAHAWHAIAAFELHQIAETLYKAVLLVFTAYSPKTHDLAELGRLCSQACPDLGPLVPHGAPARARLAALLRAAYLDARYSLAFEVSRQDLESLAGHIHAFQARADRACRTRIASLTAAASQDALEEPGLGPSRTSAVQCWRDKGRQHMFSSLPEAMILLSTIDRRRYFLVPDPEALQAGELMVQSMTGESRMVSAEAAARFEVPEAVAKAWAEEQIDGLTTALTTAQTQFDQMTGEARRHIEDLTRPAGMQNPNKVLATLGVDPTGKPEDILRQLTDMIRRFGTELPEAARGALDLQERLRISSAPRGRRADASTDTDALGALLAAIGNDPDADPQLSEAAAELQALAHSLGLDESSGETK